MMSKIMDIQVPPNALTTCPDRRYALVSIQGCCVPCPHFVGLIDVVGEVQVAPFAARYRVQCGIPQVREIIQAEMGDVTK
jgi:hypothetical protein